MTGIFLNVLSSLLLKNYYLRTKTRVRENINVISPEKIVPVLFKKVPEPVCYWFYVALHGKLI